jgi:hypothetical protein
MQYQKTHNVKIFIGISSDEIIVFPTILKKKYKIDSNKKYHLPQKLVQMKLVLLWAQLTKIYPPLPTSVQPISITKTLLINLSSVSQNVLKFYQQLTGEERRVPLIFGRNNQ